MSVPQVMKLLMDEQKDKEQGKKPDGEGGEGGQPGKGKPGPMDTHIMRKPGKGNGQPGEDDAETGGLNAKELKKQLKAMPAMHPTGEGCGASALRVNMLHAVVANNDAAGAASSTAAGGGALHCCLPVRGERGSANRGAACDAMVHGVPPGWVGSA
jgi:hypothetical protein